MKQEITWIIIGSLIFFGGWIIKDQPFYKPIGQFAMSIGFVIYSALMIKAIWRSK